MIDTYFKTKLHKGQKKVHYAEERFKVLAAGRRWGKTRLGVNECLATALEGGCAWWVAPTYKMCDVGWRPLIKMARLLGDAEILKAEHTIRLPGGGWVGIRSADNPDSLRGDGLDLVIMDECAYMHEETWSEVIRPALSDKLGSALFISTPKGRNWFWDVYQKGLRGDKNWRSFHFTSYDNPFLKKEEIDDARKDIPESVFRQEYLAEFIESEGAVFRNVDRCAVLKPSKPDWQRSYTGGADIASTEDFTVITILDSEKREMVWQERFNRVDYPILERRIIETYHRWHLKSMTVEANGVGKGVIDHLREEGLNIIPFLTSNKSKQEIIQNLQVAFEREEIRVLDDERLKHELLSFESSRLASGGFQYKAPGGGHDDCVMALAIAWDSLRVQERRFEGVTIEGKDPVEEIDNQREP
jgi:phage terminase large subunit-like protein